MLLCAGPRPSPSSGISFNPHMDPILQNRERTPEEVIQIPLGLAGAKAHTGVQPKSTKPQNPSLFHSPELTRGSIDVSTEARSHRIPSSFYLHSGPLTYPRTKDINF